LNISAFAWLNYLNADKGRVRGLAGLRVADASIMPFVLRANTNLPAIVVGEKIAAALLADLRA